MGHISEIFVYTWLIPAALVKLNTWLRKFWTNDLVKTKESSIS